MTGDNVVSGQAVGRDCQLRPSACHDVEEESRKHTLKGS